MIGTEERTVVVTGFSNDIVVTYSIAWIRCDRDGCDATHVVQSACAESAWESAQPIGWTWDGDKRDGCPLHPIAAPTE